MSQFLPNQFKEQETKPSRTPEQGPESYLSPEERKFWQRGLGFPEDFPPKYKSWLLDFIAVNIPQIPLSQIVGYERFVDSQVTITAAVDVNTAETTTSTSFVDLATVGPRLTDLQNGQYLILFGCTMRSASDGNGVVMGVQIDSTAASDSEAAHVGTQQFASSMRAISKTLTGDTTHTITAKYRNAGGVTGFFQYRWLTAIRTGNAEA